MDCKATLWGYQCIIGYSLSTRHCSLYGIDFPFDLISQPLKLRSQSIQIRTLLVLSHFLDVLVPLEPTFDAV